MIKPASILIKFSEGIRSAGSKIFFNPYKKIGISWLSIRRLKYFSRPGIKTHVLFGHPTYFFETPEYFHGLHEIFIDEIYKQALPVQAFVIDCGSHIGLSVLYIKKICPTAHVIAYEPDEKNYGLLQQNIASHSLHDVELRNEAVWNEDTFLDFLQDGSMSSKIVSAEEPTAVKVHAARLKEIINRKIDFLKLDIEGAEYQVIKDIADRLHYVNNLFIEYHGKYHQNEELSEMIAILVKDGFSFYIKEAENVTSHPFYHNNAVKAFDLQLNIFAFKK